MRLKGKAGIVVGAGQSIGTGRAAALLFAQEGAKVLLADRDLESALETATMIDDAGGTAECMEDDVMREQGSGSIVNISSIAALAAAVRLTAYKISKAGVNALSQSLAIDNAAHGIRVNTIMPGLLDTPMAVDARAEHLGVPREQVVAQRNAMVPLGARMGTGWDVAYASLFLHSDEAGFITGPTLPVDGGQLARVGGEGRFRSALMSAGRFPRICSADHPRA
jgi:NAD(P)-dependent dehydrogenase (short-subunit alcohol dehydrogenase family)